MRTRSKGIIALLLTILLMAGGLLTLFLYYTTGTLYAADGYTQSSHVYFEELTYAESPTEQKRGSFYFSVCNRSRHNITFGSKIPKAFFWDAEHNKWAPMQPALVWEEGFVGDSFDGILESFDTEGHGFYSIAPLPPGLYRLVLESEDFAVVGYITVTA